MGSCSPHALLIIAFYLQFILEFLFHVVFTLLEHLNLSAHLYNGFIIFLDRLIGQINFKLYFFIKLCQFFVLGPLLMELFGQILVAE